MRRLAVIVLGSLAALSTGCATSQEWAEWKSHSAHFASGDHMGFSLRNREGTPARVTRVDVETSRAQAWWGKPITVDQAQVLEN